jgi:hypothetical protein
LASLITFSQTVYFKYAASGNRIKRSLSALKASDQVVKDTSLFRVQPAAGTLVQAEQLSVFPNPVKDELNIEVTAAATLECECRLYDLAGKELDRFKAVNGSNRVNFNSYPPGTYLLTINNPTLKGTWKIVKN